MMGNFIGSPVTKAVEGDGAISSTSPTVTATDDLVIVVLAVCLRAALELENLVA